MKLNRTVKNVLRNSIRFLLSKETYIKARFLYTHGYVCDLEKPKSWNEKIQSRKLNCDAVHLSKFVDKYEVRQYVNDTIGTEYLIPLLKIKSSISPSDFSDLPNEFVMKTTNGGGGENVVVVRDKTKVDFNLLCKKFNGYLNVKIGSKVDELYYDVIPPKIVFEKLILNDNGTLPSDYKIHVFRNGGESKVFIQIDADRFGNHKRSIYDESKNKMNFNIQPKYESIDPDYILPENLESMILISKKLSVDFEYVRVDLYSVRGKIYFGELTFSHGSGWEPVAPKHYDFELGGYWK